MIAGFEHLGPWIEQAACAEAANPEIWFTPEFADLAMAICSPCPVKAECAKLRQKDSGVWGGRAYYKNFETRGLSNKLKVWNTQSRRREPIISSAVRAAGTVECYSCKQEWFIAHDSPSELGVSGHICPECIPSLAPTTW